MKLCFKDEVCIYRSFQTYSNGHLKFNNGKFFPFLGYDNGIITSAENWFIYLFFYPQLKKYILSTVSQYMYCNYI